MQERAYDYAELHQQLDLFTHTIEAAPPQTLTGALRSLVSDELEALRMALSTVADGVESETHRRELASRLSRNS